MFLEFSLYLINYILYWFSEFVTTPFIISSAYLELALLTVLENDNKMSKLALKFSFLTAKIVRHWTISKFMFDLIITTSFATVFRGREIARQSGN